MYCIVLPYILVFSTTSIVTSYVQKCRSTEIQEPNLPNWKLFDYNFKIYIKIKNKTIRTLSLLSLLRITGFKI